MSYVLMMLSSEWALPQPKKPGFFTERDLIGDSSSSSNNNTDRDVVGGSSSSSNKNLCSINELTISQTDPR